MKRQFSLPAYRSRLLLLLGVVALCGALVACARMASKPEMPAEPAEPTVPVEFAQNIEMSLRNMLLALTRPEILAAPQTGPGADSAALASCQVESMGDATDSDGDNYPVAETRTFACDVVFISGTASLVLMDKDDADPASGVKAEATSEYSFFGGEGPGLSFTADVTLEASRSDGDADYGIESLGSLGVVAPFSRIEHVGMYEATLGGTFLAGTVVLQQGGFTFTTTATDCETLDAAMQEECRQAVQEAPSGSIEYGVSTSGLMYDAANCATTFTGGYFDVRDAGGNVLKSTYDGCSPATVTYNGQPVPVPPLEG